MGRCNLKYGTGLLGEVGLGVAKAQTLTEKQEAGNSHYAVI